MALKGSPRPSPSGTPPGGAPRERVPPANRTPACTCGGWGSLAPTAGSREQQIPLLAWPESCLSFQAPVSPLVLGHQPEPPAGTRLCPASPCPSDLTAMSGGGLATRTPWALRWGQSRNHVPAIGPASSHLPQVLGVYSHAGSPGPSGVHLACRTTLGRPRGPHP